MLSWGLCSCYTWKRNYADVLKCSPIWSASVRRANTCSQLSATFEREYGSDCDWVRFSVADTGIGIAPEQMTRLFQPFVQVHQTSSSRKYGGTGLGLALSQQLCCLPGGDIAVVSEVGKGSVFTVCLPAVISAAHTANVRLDVAQSARSAIPHDVDRATMSPSLHTTTTLSV